MPKPDGGGREEPVAGFTFPSRDARRTAIAHVTVVPMDSDQVLADRTVIIEAGRIKAIQSSSAVATAAVTVDGTGKYLMPGIADMHVHWWDVTEYAMYLANGVTTVRNMWGAPMHLALKRKIAEGAFPGPQLVTTSPIVDGPGANGRTIWPGSIMISTPAEAAPAVKRIAARGYDQLKVYSWLAPEPHAALCAAAAEAGLLVTGHCPDSIPFERAIANGQRCFEHLTAINYGHFQPGVSVPDPKDRANRQAIALLTIEKLDLDAIRRLASDMAAKDVWNCPTTTVWQQSSQRREAALADPNLRFVPPTTRATWDPSQDFRWRGLPVTSEEYLGVRRRLNERYLELVSILHEEGAPLLVGTDTPNPYVVPGFSVHQELQNFVTAGMRPYEALRGATAEAARFLGQADEWGTIAVGMRADLLLLPADPLKDVGALRDLSAVFVNGFHFSRADLDAALEDRARIVEHPSGSSTELDPAADGTEIVREGVLREVIAGSAAGQVSFRHTRIPGDGIRVEERYANTQDRTTSQVRTISLDLDADGTIRSGEQRMATYLGEQVVDVRPDGSGLRVHVREMDGFESDARLSGPIVPSDRMSATALAIVAARATGSATVAGLSIEQGQPLAIPIAIAPGEQAGDWVLKSDRGNEEATQTYTVTPDGALVKVSEMSFRGLRELAPDHTTPSDGG